MFINLVLKIFDAFGILILLTLFLNQEKIRVALYVQKAALQFIDGNGIISKYLRKLKDSCLSLYLCLISIWFLSVCIFVLCSWWTK